jgi:ABC-type transporter Mla MlaB component
MKKNSKTPYEVTPSVENGAKKATISLAGNLSYDELPEIKLLMMQNLDKYQLFQVTLQDVENIDLGLIQLLYSFRWTVERKSKKVTFNLSLPDEHKTLLEHTGFLELLNINK